MSHRIIHRGKDLTVTIDGKVCKGSYGQTILEIARANDLYISTMCYLTKASPIASCRMCVVDVEGVDGYILSCQEKAVDGAKIITQNDELNKHRQNIIKLYGVNHPLQCGVCDKSGECELQNKTLELGVDSQEFSAIEQNRENKKWGILGYDPYLCIMCEKCVHTCNEVIGAQALFIEPGGYKSVINIDISRCEQCGDCISVCPVGAMVSNGYKYSSNAWESTQIPASCAHCSSACPLYYEVKHNGTNKMDEEKITRVKNDFEFSSLCGAGRFGFDFENRGQGKCQTSLAKAVEAVKNADTIKFDSYITNEEAKILQMLKERLGLKLVNEDAYNFKIFMNGYSSVVGKSLYSGDSDTIANSDCVIMLGTRIRKDNPVVKYKTNIAVKRNRAEFIYMHPIDDVDLKDKYTQFVKYEVGSEEGVLALLAQYLTKEQPQNIKSYLDDLDIGYLSAEASVGEEELEAIVKKLIRKQNPTLVIGEDVFGHDRAENIGKLVGIIEKYSDIKVVVIPSQTNTLGVSLICDLDQKCGDNIVGYNQKGDFVISSDGNGDFNVPALNQQEGTFVNIDKKVLNTNVALSFDGYCLNDILNEFLSDVERTENTIEYTDKLPKTKGFKRIEFDDLDFGFDNSGKDKRGYALNNCSVDIDEEIEEVEDIAAYDGTVIYRCEPLHQFNYNTAKASLLNADSCLRGSESFARAAKISDGDKVDITYNNKTSQKMFKIDTTIKGTVALYPTFDEGLSSDLISSGYRYKQVKIQKVEQL